MRDSSLKSLLIALEGVNRRLDALEKTVSVPPTPAYSIAPVLTSVAELMQAEGVSPEVRAQVSDVRSRRMVGAPKDYKGPIYPHAL